MKQWRRTIITAAICWRAVMGTPCADVVIDTDAVSHTFDGLGAQIWSGDTAVGPLLADLNMTHVRMELGPNWAMIDNPPADGTRASFDAYVAQHYGSSRRTNMQTSMAMLNALGIRPIFNQFHVPSSWRTTWGVLRSEHFQDYALLWGAMLVYLDAAGVRPQYVELFNEPEGTWNCRVTPEGYNDVLKLTRAELDFRGFSDVKIIGPGLAYLDHNSGGANYINALDPDAMASLGAFSSHAWDETFSQGCGPEFIRQRWVPFGSAIAAKDPFFEKPIFVTEYMTGNRTFHGVTYPAPGDNYDYSASDTLPFAVRVFENTLSMIYAGASVMILWEAADQSWSSAGWGLQRRAVHGSVRRPVYYAMKTLADLVPPGSQVLVAPAQPDNDIYLVAFATPEGVSLAAVNGTDSSRTKTVVFDNCIGVELFSSLAYSAAGYTNGTEFFTINADDQIVLNMPSDSVLVLAFNSEPIISTVEKVLEWKCEGNLDDTSGNENHATTATGGFTFARGKFGQALAMDGTEAVIELLGGVNLPLQAEDNWSMSLWVYTDVNISVGGNYHALALAAMGTNSWSKNGNARSIGNWGWGSGISFYSTTMVPTGTGVPYDTGRWQLITITYDHSLWQEQGTDSTGESLKIYKDGSLISSFNPQGRYYTGGFRLADNIVSLLPTIPDAAENRFVGKLDEFTIWRGVLSPTQIQNMALQAPVFGDLNGDGVVDLADLAVFFGLWLSTSADCVADLDDNQIVNLYDFAALANQIQ